MYISRTFQGLPRDTSRFIQTRLVEFNIFSRTSRRCIKVHTGKAMQYPTNFSRTVNQEIQARLFKIPKRFKDYQEIHRISDAFSHT